MNKKTETFRVYVAQRAAWYTEYRQPGCSGCGEENYFGLPQHSLGCKAKDHRTWKEALYVRMTCSIQENVSATPMATELETQARQIGAWEN